MGVAGKVFGGLAVISVAAFSVMMIEAQGDNGGTRQFAFRTAGLRL